MEAESGDTRVHPVERWQVIFYAAAVASGAALGLAAPGAGEALGGAIWPALGLLLFATFAQTPIARIGEALSARRFLAAILLGNFALVPLFVFGLSRLVPGEHAGRPECAQPGPANATLQAIKSWPA